MEALGQLDGVEAIVALVYRASFLEVPVKGVTSLECVFGKLIPGCTI